MAGLYPEEGSHPVLKILSAFRTLKETSPAKSLGFAQSSQGGRFLNHTHPPRCPFVSLALMNLQAR